MDSEKLLSSLLVLAGIIVVVLVIAFLYETGRRIYFWAAAKLFGWSEHEKFERETARVTREFKREKSQGEKDANAFRYTDRRRMGVYIATVAIAAVAWPMDLPWWHIGLIAAGAYVGLTMAAGLAWKLW